MRGLGHFKGRALAYRQSDETVLLLILSACAGPSYVAGRRIAPPASHAEDRFEGKEGVKLFTQSWRPAEQPKAVVVLVHGLKDYSDRYGELAATLVRHGYAVHAFDLRGHGDSEGDRVWVERFEEYLDDLDLFLKRVRAAEPGQRVFLFGHSMGGAIVTLYRRMTAFAPPIAVS